MIMSALGFTEFSQNRRFWASGAGWTVETVVFIVVQPNLQEPIFFIKLTYRKWRIQPIALQAIWGKIEKEKEIMCVLFFPLQTPISCEFLALTRYEFYIQISSQIFSNRQYFGSYPHFVLTSLSPHSHYSTCHRYPQPKGWGLCFLATAVFAERPPSDCRSTLGSQACPFDIDSSVYVSVVV